MASKDDNFNLKWRAYIEFRTILKIQPVQIFSELQEILCVDCPSRSIVERWAARFRSGDADVTDLPDPEDRYPPPLQRISHSLRVWSWKSSTLLSIS
ncbi:hypothetical protein LOD99_15519 [Oopsacas minuta]|uniref:Mos1 transposase HTH domain-containing protein n=1 Tax=Oopsacas minuta TaxID=111878 RepID=A0AAV7KBE7_9METZ|nr:hypothetical protein LOD99_15519 [Oopsacas minuta]